MKESKWRTDQPRFPLFLLCFQPPDLSSRPSQRCLSALFVLSVWCVRSVRQANEDHRAADGENFRDQIRRLDDRPAGVSQKQQGELSWRSSRRAPPRLLKAAESALMIYIPPLPSCCSGEGRCLWMTTSDFFKNSFFSLSRLLRSSVKTLWFDCYNCEWNWAADGESLELYSRLCYATRHHQGLFYTHTH